MKIKIDLKLNVPKSVINLPEVQAWVKHAEVVLEDAVNEKLVDYKLTGTLEW